MPNLVEGLLSALRSRTARIVLITLLLASIPLYILSSTLIPKTGTWDLNVNGGEWSSPASDVVPHGSAWNAGIRNGDIVTVPPGERFKYFYPAANERMRVQVGRGAALHDVYLTAHPAQIQFGAPELIRAIVSGCLLLFSLLIIACAWNTEFVPLIAAMLTMNVFDAAIDKMPVVPTTVMPRALIDFAQFVSEPVYCAQVFLLTGLCALVAGKKSRALSFLLWISLANLLAGVVVGITTLPKIYITLPRVVVHLQALHAFLDVVLPVIALVVARCVSSEEGRSRILWLFWGFFPNSVGIALANLAVLWFLPPTFVNHPLLNTVARVLELSAPIALFYGLLERRTVDIGFVFNRVAVYGFISAIVLGGFVLLEYSASHFLEARGAASWGIQLAIALVIGIGARYLHGAVDRFVDRVFFAKRHADELALKRFAHEADAFTSADSLLDRALEVLNAHCETAGAGIYLCEENTVKLVRGSAPFPDAVDMDDALLVALRRWGEPVDTHDAKTEFPDGMVFPMNARGKLIGALACRTKRDTTAFAPDERESLMQVAHSLAHALEVLGAKSAVADDPLSQAILAMQRTLLEIRNAVVSTATQ